MNAVSFSRMLLLTLPVAAGCESPRQAAPEEPFFPAGPSPVAHIMCTQAACGARFDATLRDCHFDGAALNSLGREKLDLMCSAAADGPVSVYLDLPAGDSLAAARKSEVEKHLKSALADGRPYTIAAGANPATYHPARPPKTDAADSPAPMDLGARTAPASPGAAGR